MGVFTTERYLRGHRFKVIRESCGHGSGACRMRQQVKACNWLLRRPEAMLASRFPIFLCSTGMYMVERQKEPSTAANATRSFNSWPVWGCQ